MNIIKTLIKRIISACFFLNTVVYAEVATDGTMGGFVDTTNGTFTSNGYYNHPNIQSGVMTIPQAMGTTVGDNLFHSFATFNISNTESATFTGVNTLQNVISRVTGGQVSNLDGLLKSEVGNANFYFINPAGVLFGANASINVPAAFHVSTANQINFLNGAYSATTPNSDVSTFSAAPESFGFLGTSTANNGLITFNSTQLVTKLGKTLDVVAGDITLQQSSAKYPSLKAEAGEIRLVAAGTGEVNVPVDGFATTATGSLLIDSSTLDVSGDGAGKLTLQGGNININYSDLFADNTGQLNATTNQGVTISANNLTLNNNAHLSASTYDSGNGGSINVNSDTIQINNSSKIEASVFYSPTTYLPAKGNAGNVIVTANRDLTLNNKSYIRSLTYWGAGNAGDVTVKATNGDITLQNGSYISSETYYGKGHAGNVNVEATNGVIQVLSDADIASQSLWGSGNAGSVTVKANALKIDGQGATGTTNTTGISVEAYDTDGGAGDINVQVSKGIEILNGGGISASSNGSSATGNITVTADTLTIDRKGNTFQKTGIDSVGYDNNNIGKINVTTTGAMEVLNGGLIQADTYGINTSDSFNSLKVIVF